jgi:hypothetical protein
MVLAVIWAVWLLERVRVPGPVIGAGALGLAALLYANGAITRDHVFMDHAYEQLRAVDRLAADDDVPIVFAGVRPDQMPPALYHPNTHRVVASPLASTFGRRFLNLGLHPYAPDPQPDEDDVEAAMRKGDADEAYVVQVLTPDEPIGEPIAGDLVGSATLEIPMLDRPLDGHARWRFPRFTILVSLVKA